MFRIVSLLYSILAVQKAVAGRIINEDASDPGQLADPHLMQPFESENDSEAVLRLQNDVEDALHWNGSLRSGCPDLSELPTVMDNQFIGMRRYNDLGNDVPGLSCNGKYYDEVDEYQWTGSHDSCRAVGSLFVHPGCTFTGWCGNDWKGIHHEFKGPKFISQVPVRTFCLNTVNHNGWTPCTGSYVVDCKQHYPDCKASDEWVSIAKKNNSCTPTNCKDDTFTYRYKRGSKYSVSMEEGFSVSATVEAEMKKAFFNIFDVTLGVSVTTGYDWSQTTTEDQMEEREFENQILVPSGGCVEIFQAVGKCGESVVYAFSIVNRDCE